MYTISRLDIPSWLRVEFVNSREMKGDHKEAEDAQTANQLHTSSKFLRPHLDAVSASSFLPLIKLQRGRYSEHAQHRLQSNWAQFLVL